MSIHTKYKKKKNEEKKNIDLNFKPIPKNLCIIQQSLNHFNIKI